jgi:hypothetical protein
MQDIALISQRVRPLGMTVLSHRIALRLKHSLTSYTYTLVARVAKVLLLLNGA